MKEVFKLDIVNIHTNIAKFCTCDSLDELQQTYAMYIDMGLIDKDTKVDAYRAVFKKDANNEIIMIKHPLIKYELKGDIEDN